MKQLKDETIKFNGGISPFEKSGNPGSFHTSNNLDLHQDPNYVTLAQSVSKVSGTTVVDLVKWIKDASPFDTNRYAYGDAGNVYKITSSDVFSNLRTVSGGVGGGLEVFDDFLYYPTATTLGRYGRLSGTPAFNDDFLSDGTTNIDQSSTTTGQTYTVPTSITENAANTKSFTPTRDPLKAIQISVNTVGTATWTLTLHDSNNVVLGTVSIVTGSMTTGFVTFTFTSPIRLTIGNAYHFHVTVASGTSKVDTSTISDLSTIAYKTVFGILVSDTWHTMAEFLNTLAICNSNYLATWNRAVYNPNTLTFKKGYTARSLAKYNEYLVIACSKGSDVTASEANRLYFWDGIASTFNFFVDVSMGMPMAIHTKFNKLLGLYGSSASLNLGAYPFQQVQDVATNLAPTKYVEVYPGAITEWQTKTYIGIGGLTDDASLTQGVYEYGSLNTQYPDVLSYMYKISTGTTTGITTKIGCVYGIGDSMYVGWRDNTTYGVDKVKKSNTAVNQGEWGSLLRDYDSPLKTKAALRLVIRHTVLLTGETVVPKYRMERATNWTYCTSATTDSAAGITSYTFVPSALKFREIEFGFKLTSSNGTYPKVLSVYFEYDPLENEIFSS